MQVIDLRNRDRQLHTDMVPRTACALGFFDGVHIGHRALLASACDAAEQIGASPAVWTLSAPPFPERGAQITDMNERLALFASAGIRYVFLSSFSEIQSFSPERFVEEILLGVCRVSAVVCGFNFRFGAGARGNSDTLSALLAHHGIPLHIIDPVMLDEAPVSSTRIRAALSAGDIELAARLLGRLYSINRTVVHGKALGRKIGIPTVNQAIPPYMQIPKEGTYASVVTLDGIAYPSVTNIGRRPTVDEDDHVLNAETHIIGFDGWLYDRPLSVSLRRRLRDEMAFNSIDALCAQIHCDIAASVSLHESTSDFKTKEIP